MKVPIIYIIISLVLRILHFKVLKVLMIVSCGRYYKIVTSSENYSTILSKLREEGINLESDNGSELLPITTIEVHFSFKPAK